MFVSVSKQLTKQPADFILSLREATTLPKNRNPSSPIITNIYNEAQSCARVQGNIALNKRGSSHILKGKEVKMRLALETCWLEVAVPGWIAAT